MRPEAMLIKITTLYMTFSLVIKVEMKLQK